MKKVWVMLTHEWEPEIVAIFDNEFSARLFLEKQEAAARLNDAYRAFPRSERDPHYVIREWDVRS